MIPEGYYKIENIIELKRVINPRLSIKNLYKDSNIEPDPQQLYMYSPKQKKLLPKWYWSGAPEDKIIELIKKGLIYGRPIQKGK